MPQVTFKGQPVILKGNEVKVGDQAPSFTVVANDLSEVTLDQLDGKIKIINAVPSIDTPVCEQQTRRFNEEASQLDDVTVVAISVDLPFAQKRWCAAEGIDRVVLLSDHRELSFGKAYGVLIPHLRLLARAVFVIDTTNTVIHAQYVPEVTEQPDYDAVLQAVRQALSSQS
ncbi:thiol peroxidase [Caldalkalibacillus thermarum TA2.A1]|uniref:Thiol peroxidase n=1 Tax=Caldalkalibacillus thermarum (strain TA2.A1) TaxID=986075 RepID=F5L8I5_CALTT|nr:thiol peroxidase [Caldalkalibacillus thermarum]EGL82324.1 thiol peroxidase [Caldalkalibacillus thermarum TA2.A1]QZT32889.1 thiol peroxidase [Caldalkalibacillus thermarum TA2.A1]GGK26950.1 putative thiol peroxidase [Caldalkalibacillus thermarum]